MDKYRIKYTVILNDNQSINNKEIKIDNCLSNLHAKVKLEDYLKRKYLNFKQLVVESCQKSNGFTDMFGTGDLGLNDLFGGIFNKK